MIIGKNEYKTEYRQNMKGGNGTAAVTDFVTKDELNGKGRLFGKIHLEPGSSIGYHVHEGESELFHILNGQPTYNDNGTEYTLNEGDTAVVSSGNGHGISNNTDDPVDLIALIIFA